MPTLSLAHHRHSIKSQPLAYKEFEEKYYLMSGNRYLREFMIDFRMAFPSAEEIFEDGRMLAQKRIDTLVRNQVELHKVVSRDIYLANQEGPKEPKRLTDEAFERNRAIVVSKHGEGSAQVRAYDAAWGSVIVAANTTQGQVYETLVGSERTVEVGGIEVVEKLQASKNTLVVLLYGATQIPGDTENILGFDNLRLQLSNFEHVLATRSANIPVFGNPDNLSIEDALFEIKISISDYVLSHPEIDSIILAGYSRGGGQAYEISRWLSNSQNFHLTLLGTAYVDAVNASSDTVWHSEGRIPVNTLSFLNIFQSQTSPFQDELLELHGIRVQGIEEKNLQLVQQIDLDAMGLVQTHGSIDNYSVPLLYDYIIKALSFRIG